MSDPPPRQNATPSRNEMQFPAQSSAKRKMTPRTGLADTLPLVAMMKQLDGGAADKIAKGSPANKLTEGSPTYELTEYGPANKVAEDGPANDLGDYEKSDEITEQMAAEMAEGSPFNYQPTDSPTPAIKYTQRGTRHANRPVTSFRHDNMLHRNKNPSTAFSQASEMSYIPGKPDELSTGDIHGRNSFEELLSTFDVPESPSRRLSQPPPLRALSRNRILSSTKDARVATDLLSRRESLIGLSLAQYTDKKQKSLMIGEAAQALGRGIDVDVAGWQAYLNSYCHGHYDLNSPPEPNFPMGINYLPAPYALDEAQRTGAANDYVCAWNVAHADAIMVMVGKIASKMVASHVVVSFFTPEHEIRLAESYHHDKSRERKVPRYSSLLAHALYSDQVLVVLNTSEDWRFKDNPLVTGWPNIKFFAAAPMIVDDQVIGVVGVFDTAPRDTFSDDEEYLLARLGRYIISRLDEDIELDLKTKHDNQQSAPRKIPFRAEGGRISSNIYNVINQRSVSTPAIFSGSAPSPPGDDQAIASLRGIWTNYEVPSAASAVDSLNGQHENSHTRRTEEFPAENYDQGPSPLSTYHSGTGDHTESSPLLPRQQPQSRKKIATPFVELKNKAFPKSSHSPHLEEDQLNSQSRHTSAQTAPYWGDLQSATGDRPQVPAPALVPDNQWPNAVPPPRSASNSCAERTVTREHQYTTPVGQSDHAFPTASNIVPQTTGPQASFDMPSRTPSGKLSRQGSRLLRFSFNSSSTSKDSQGSDKEPHIKGSSKISVPGLGIELRSPIVCSPTLRSPIIFAKPQVSPVIGYDPDIRSNLSDASSIRTVASIDNLRSSGTPLLDPSRLSRTPSNAFQIDKTLCACHQIAVSLGYDMVYIMAIETSRPPSKDNLILNIKSIYPEGAQKDLQEKMGSEHRELHPLALYMGPMTYDVQNSKLGNLTWGTLIPLFPIDRSKPRVKGLVLGAYRSSKKPDNPAIVSQIEQTLYFALKPCIEDQTMKEAKRAYKENNPSHRNSYNSGNMGIRQRVADVPNTEHYRSPPMNMSTGYATLVSAQRGMGREKPTLRREPGFENMRAQQYVSEPLRRPNTRSRVDDRGMKDYINDSASSYYTQSRDEDRGSMVQRADSRSSPYTRGRGDDRGMMNHRSVSAGSTHTRSRVDDRGMSDYGNDSASGYYTTGRDEDRETMHHRTGSASNSYTTDRVEGQGVYRAVSTSSSHTMRPDENRGMTHSRAASVSSSHTRTTEDARKEKRISTLGALDSFGGMSIMDHGSSRARETHSSTRDNYDNTSIQPVLRHRQSELDQQSRVSAWVLKDERAKFDQLEHEERQKVRRILENEMLQKQRRADGMNARAKQSIDDEKRMSKRDSQMDTGERAASQDRQESSYQQSSRDREMVGEERTSPRGRLEPTFQQISREDRRLRAEHNRRTYLGEVGGSSANYKGGDYYS